MNTKFNDLISYIGSEYYSQGDTLTNFYTKTETYDKTYINNNLVSITQFNNAVSLYYTRLYIDSTFTGYYTKTQTNYLFYNKTEVDALFILNTPKPVDIDNYYDFKKRNKDVF